MVRVGVIGLGVHGMRYVRHIVRDVEGMELAAVCRRDPEEAARVGAEFDVPWFVDAEEMMDRVEPDAVVVVTPPPSHLRLARAALQRGIAVALEKPMTQTLDEARTLRSIVEETGRPLFVTQSLRYNRGLLAARDALDRIGPLRSLTASQRLPRTDLTWQNTEATHPLGSILNTGVHLFDLVRWMLGAEFTTVFCQARRIENPFHEDLFKLQATLRDRDTLVALEVAKCTQSRSSNLELVGEHGQLWVDYQTDEVVLVEGTSRTVLREAGPTWTIPDLLADFAARVASGHDMPIDVVDGLRTLEVVEACYSSLGKEKPVPVVRAD